VHTANASQNTRPRPYAELAKRIPSFARNVKVTGTAAEEVMPVLKTRAASAAPTAQYDAVVVAGPQQPVNGQDPLGSPESLSQLHENGFVFVLCPNRQYWRGCPDGHTLEDIRTRIEPAGLALYAHLTLIDSRYAGLQPDKNGVMNIEGKTFSVSTPDDRERLLATHYLFMAVRPSYNPVMHARTLCEDGHPDWAYEVLSLIPAVYLENPQVFVTVGMDMMACLVQIDSMYRDGKTLVRFWLSQTFFYQVIARAPLSHFAYQCQAELWRRLGNMDMATRLLRSVLHAAPDDDTQAQLTQLERITRGSLPRDVAPQWDPKHGPTRILMITHPRPHYGLDVLYDGLCHILGPENVIEFPHKPFLHGTTPEELAYYPCLFQWPGTPHSFDEMVGRLRDREFDVVLFADIEQSLDSASARCIVEAAGDTPIFLVDARDECDDPRDATFSHLGLRSVAGVFKREMLIGVDYGPNAFPLPFAYPEDRVSPDITAPRTEDIFWAGHRNFGMRRLYLERLEKALGRTLDKTYAQDEYVGQLRRSRIGINIFGFGFDTVRYWEIPAHGAMLFSERLPIRIPHNFEDGVSAVFFDDLADLETRLAYYREHAEESSAIAQAGYEHLKRFHTSSARARQMLACIQNVIAKRA